MDALVRMHEQYLNDAKFARLVDYIFQSTTVSRDFTFAEFKDALVFAMYKAATYEYRELNKTMKR